MEQRVALAMTREPAWTDLSPETPALKFRPDIDGLRALAIGAVLLFHFDLLGARGGFAGVDMFFVVSGYLMTGMLSRATPSLSTVAAFYRRRFWRIVPAYYVTIALTLAVGTIVLLPVDAERLGMSAVAAVAFVPNFFFSAGVGYFDTAAIYKPLLHTWSLGVEAQFYLVWPVLVVALMRLRPSMRTTAYVAIVFISLIFCQIFAIADPKVAFFSLPARLWQFGLGALAIEAQRLRFLPPRSRVPSILRAAACVAIFVTPWLVGEGDAWPAPSALPICLATAILLWLGDEPASLTSRFLSSRPMTFVGRISYSLYLVHWPVIVFVTYGFFPQAPLALRVLLLIACVPLATALYHWIEAPMRLYGRPAALPRWHVAMLAFVPAAALVGGYGLHLEPARFQSWPPTAETAPWPNLVCTPWQSTEAARPYCLLGTATNVPHSFLWGDSHAEHLLPGFAALLAHQHESMVVAAKDACPPIAGVLRVSNAFQRRQDCLRDNESALATARATTSITTVIIAARWAYYAQTTRFGGEKGSRSFLITPASAELSTARSQRLFGNSLESEIDELLQAGKHVVLVAQVPEMGFDAWRCVAMKGGANCDLPRTIVAARQDYVDNVFHRLAEKPGVKIVDPKDVLCDAALCRATLDGVSAYRDDNHLGAAASRRIVEQLFGNGGNYE
jgi:peptidoglycan/LPS O-acetylase OafA/YrhL